jgi:dihydroorotate dehydrogenase electron transfer subunit
MEMRMACGSGVCYGCTIKTRNGLKQVCKDGPVFELSDIVWDEMTRLI